MFVCADWEGPRRVHARLAIPCRREHMNEGRPSRPTNWTPSAPSQSRFLERDRTPMLLSALVLCGCANYQPNVTFGEQQYNNYATQ